MVSQIFQDCNLRPRFFFGEKKTGRGMQIHPSPAGHALLDPEASGGGLQSPVVGQGSARLMLERESEERKIREGSIESFTRLLLPKMTKSASARQAEKTGFATCKYDY
uniref:Uncharacterized protein n=1 Tax=Oryza glumipatula TaxID=40148 RepID=A0A0E0A0L6_9ORYZ